MSKLIPKKIRNFFYNKTTLMVIPHSEKDVVSFHISNFTLVLSAIVLLLLLILGTFFTFKIREKAYNYEYNKQEYTYYKQQINQIHKVLPNISESQQNISNKLHSLLGVLGISRKVSFEDSLEQKHTISQLENIDGKMQNISKYIKSFRVLFKDLPSIFPIVSRKYWFTSPYGWRTHPITLRREFHPGLDIAAFPGTPIQATADGVVEHAGWRGGYGIAVYLKHKNGYSTRYAHMLRLGADLTVGSTVKKGQILGYVGSTGVSTGYHLHYEVRLNGETQSPNKYLWLDRFWW